ncbi:GumC family protein [Novosphingobium aquae]|uniref:non-specific protein-tyrosine kinase n=1 Tax=Novosphingobium aquae TaxID=3133435 RepID=A0ABU8SDX2_9SPHN
MQSRNSSAAHVASIETVPVGSPAFEMTGDDSIALGDFLRRWWNAAIRRIYVVLLIVALCVGVGIIKTMLTTPLYSTSSRIEISREQKNITNVEGVDQANGAYDAEFYDTQYALLKSRSLAERVVSDLRLAENASFLSAHGITSDSAGAPASLQQRNARAVAAAGVLLGGISIKPVANSKLVDISYTSPSQQWAATIANSWPRTFIAANIDRQFATTADARNYLENKLADVRAKMEQSEQALINFGSDRGIVKIGGGRDADGRTQDPQTLVATNLEAVNAALVSAKTDRIAAQSRMLSRNSEASPGGAENGGIGALRAKRAELAADYSRLLVKFDPGYPEAIALSEQIKSLDMSISRESARIISGKTAAYTEALQRERELTAQVSALKGQFDRQQRDTIQYNIYQRDVDTNRQLYDALLQRYKEIGVAGTVGATNVVVVDQARVPGGPSSPNLQRNLLLSFLAGIFLAGVTVFMLESLDQVVRDPSDVQRVLKLPLLGTVPLSEGEVLQEIVSPHSGLAEAYFSVRTSLALSTSRGIPKTIVVTSAEPGEGKSTTALGLATAIGRTGQRVLLIDADMRSPSLHERLELSNDLGVSNLLAGSEDFAAMVKETSIRGVSLLPAGPMPPSASELLASERLGRLVAKFSDMYDHLVIDAPPVIGLADAPLLARAVEGSVFVIESGDVSTRAIRNALERLQVGGTFVLGAIMTKLNISEHGYGYGYAYGDNQKVKASNA